MADLGFEPSSQTTQSTLLKSLCPTNNSDGKGQSSVLGDLEDLVSLIFHL